MNSCDYDISDLYYTDNLRLRVNCVEECNSVFDNFKGVMVVS